MSVQDIQFQPHDSPEQRLKKLRQLVEEILRLWKRSGGGGSNAPDVSDAAVVSIGDQTEFFPNSLPLIEGTNIVITQTDAGLVIEALGGGSGILDSVVGTANEISVDSTDIYNPVISLAAAAVASLGLADTAVQPGDLATVATSGDYNDLSNLPDLSLYVQSVTGTVNEIDVDNTDPQNPVLSLAAAAAASLALADTAIQPGDLSLDDLNDVNAPAPSDGDVLTFDTGTGFWIPVAPTTGGGGYPEALGYAGI